MSKRVFAVLIACFFTVFAVYCIRYSYGTLLPEMLPSLGINKTEAGVIFSAYFIVYSIFAPIAGMLADRFNTRLILTGFIGLMALGTFLMQFANSVTEASLYFAITGLGASAGWAPVMALAQRWASEKRKGAILAFVDAGSSLAVMSAGAFIPFAVNLGNWKTGWATLGIFCLVIAFVNLLFIRNRPQAETESKHSPAPTRSVWASLNYKKVLTDKKFWLIGTAYIFNCFAILAPITFVSTYAVNELSFTYQTATLLVTIIGISGTVGKLVLGPISDRAGRIRIMILAAILITGGALGMAFSKSWTLILFTLIFGIGYGSVWSLYATCASDFFSRQSPGGVIGLWTAYSGIGSIMGPIVAGFAADRTGTLASAFLVAAAAGFLSLILLIPMLKEKTLSS